MISRIDTLPAWPVIGRFLNIELGQLKFESPQFNVESALFNIAQALLIF